MSCYSDDLYLVTPWWQDPHLCRLALAGSITLICLLALVMWPLAERKPDTPSGFDMVSDQGVVEVDSVHGQSIKVVPTEDGRVTYHWQKTPTKVVGAQRVTTS